MGADPDMDPGPGLDQSLEFQTELLCRRVNKMVNNSLQFFSLKS